MFVTEQNQAKWQMPVTFGYFFSMMCLGFLGGVWGPILTSLSESTGTTASQISSVFLFLGVGFVISSLLLARLYDRLPGNRVIAVGIVVLAISLACLGRIHSIWLLFFLAVAIGCGNGLIDMGCNILLPWLLGDKCKPYFNFIHVCYALGCITTPLMISRALSTNANISFVLTILALIMLPVAVYIFLLPSPRIPVTTDKKTESHSAGNKRVWQLVAMFCVFFFLLMGGQAMYSNWISTVVFSSGIADEAMAAFMSSILWAGTICGRLVATWLSSRMRSYVMVLGGLVITIASGLLMIFAQHNLTLIMLAIFLSGFGLGPMFANAMLFLKEKALLSGRMNGFVFASNQTGAMLLPWAFGVLTNASSYFVFALVVTVVMFVTLLLLLMTNKLFPRPIEEEMEIE